MSTKYHVRKSVGTFGISLAICLTAVLVLRADPRRPASVGAAKPSEVRGPVGGRPSKAINPMVAKPDTSARRPLLPSGKVPLASPKKQPKKYELPQGKKRNNQDKSEVLQRLKTNGGAPLVAVVMRMFDEFSRGKKPANAMESAVHVQFRKAKPQVIASLLASWKSLREQDKRAIAGPALADRISEADGVRFVMDAEVNAALKKRYLAQPHDRGSNPRVPVRPGRFGQIQSPSKTQQFLDSVVADLSSVLSGHHLTGVIQDIPTQPRGIRQVIVQQVHCVDETNSEWPNNDNVFAMYLVEYWDSDKNLIVLADKVTTTLKGFSDGDKLPFSATDAIVFQAPPGVEPSVVTIGAVLWESDVDEFTASEAVGLLTKAAVDVLAEVVRSEGIPVGSFDTALKDIVDGIVANGIDVEVIGQDTMWIQATGIDGATFLTTGPSTTAERNKKHFRFKGLGGEYQLRQIRAITNPLSASSGRIDD